MQTTRGADGYGDVTGQIVLPGDAPEAKVLIAKGDKTAKDASVCAAEGVLSQELVVNPDNHGVANVFVYLAKTKDINPALKSSEESEVVFDQKGCRFEPHAMFVRTDQTVVVKSDDAIAHNTHTYPLRNQATNFLVSPSDRTGIKVNFKVAEKLPTQVKCDIHPWMSAYWLVLDHPYAAVSDTDGVFTIKGLPAGEHELIIWQEKVGYVDRKFKVTVKADTTTDVGSVEIPAAKLK
ncbi:MAG: hypothetical protein O2955_19115 [Planctomycetota bacterium]|nr:hypothetical protein [Planctomycetota bacterium]MDA1214627.1 hypothetical protein [Planctomycetota bacterium]